VAWETILYEKIDQIAQITLNRPEKRNAQNMRLIAELDEAFKEAERDPDVRVVILRGAGSSFSAGHDLSFWNAPPGQSDDIIDVNAVRGSAEGRTRLEQDMYYDKCLTIRNLSKPTIAQVHGHCIAGGVMIAAMCDIIYASEDATFSNPVLRMAASAAEILFEPWDLGPRQAKEFLFTGEPLSAADACRLGLVNKVVPREKLEEEVMALARKIALTPPVAISLTKASINRTMDIMGQSVAWQQHFVVHQLAHSTAEAQQFEESRRKASSLKDQLNYQKGTFAS
jgi:enoyl-CoA hydratase